MVRILFVGRGALFGSSQFVLEKDKMDLAQKMKLHKHWVKHLLAEKDNLSGLLDCHAKGVDSILLSSVSDARIRIFIANENHELWKNDGLTLYRSQPLSVGFHPHHCGITLEVVKGAIGNVSLPSLPEFQKEHLEKNPTVLHSFLWDTPIKGGKGRFIKTGDGFTTYWRQVNYSEGDRIYMPAQEIHTIWVAKGQKAAWIVYEEEENEEYIPLTYSDADLENFSSEGMYVPMTEKQIVDSLQEVFEI